MSQQTLVVMTQLNSRTQKMYLNYAVFKGNCDKMCILTRRKLKRRLLKVIRRLETPWREKDISQSMSKAPQRRTEGAPVCQVRYKMGKKALRSTFEESSKHIKVLFKLFKSIKRKKLE